MLFLRCFTFEVPQDEEFYPLECKLSGNVFCCFYICAGLFSQEHGKDDVTGEELVRRDDDQPEVRADCRQKQIFGRRLTPDTEALVFEKLQRT